MEEILKTLPQHTCSWLKGKITYYKCENFWADEQTLKKGFMAQQSFEADLSSGPYWDHILGYWKASIERPHRVLLLKYEDLKMEPTSNVKRLAEFIGYPFSIDEEKEGVVDKIINLCSFENLSKLEVNKTGKMQDVYVVENRIFFRKAKDGDWKNYFTDEMKEKIDKLMDEKLSGTGLVLK
ncbi:hypothetical protein L1987_75032 [Smallanthus sonchifolius]|uniref:Uncharacterized protein n=1 Tax=Smallanthus sonchifolius TaxID=185202 RepID=A0ACB9A4K5_9ASTR|nr:hypothetical protein L1987_75032 [Smallanthus sonchifolius]